MIVRGPEPPALPVVTSHRVFLDGVEIADVTYADTEAGWLARMKRDGDGQLKPAFGSFEVDILRGAVTAEPITQ